MSPQDPACPYADGRRPVTYPIATKVETAVRFAVRRRVKRIVAFVLLFRKREMTMHEWYEWNASRQPIEFR